MRIYVFIDNIDHFINGNYKWCFSASADKDYGTNYGEKPDDICIGSFEADTDVISIRDLTTLAVTEVDKEIVRTKAEAQVKLDILKDRKQTYLAIPHNKQLDKH